LSSSEADEATKLVRANFQRIERRKWWLWAAAVAITLLLTIGLASFLLPQSQLRGDPYNQYSQSIFPQAIRGLMGLVFLFDLYTIYHG